VTYISFIDSTKWSTNSIN